MYRIEMYYFYRIANQQFTEIFAKQWFIEKCVKRITESFLFLLTMLFRNIVLMMNHCNVIIHICSENFRHNDFSYMMNT